tara:strand:- start:618 stop:761 length:144 start_codon:yes stop_codon:yes gene_type:complete
LKKESIRDIKKELDHVYITTDGRKFADIEMAEAHQTIMDRIEIYSKK